ncbi:hypothetical protein CTI12_AA280450 [Artemisia annua]|uniref:Uncharacterized protein n=1 Tax=Artemisia annua TaxID=35608 RepID=A0A2U1NBM4_ARTAN|nr:hypothetical protein CTI12_AA280450 [Artemisia annua]
MAGSGDGLSMNLAGMSKNQLYDIMSQMKGKRCIFDFKVCVISLNNDIGTLIEQNQDQARQILIQNPLLTKALFQAQIMLGMLQPPQEGGNSHVGMDFNQMGMPSQPDRGSNWMPGLSENAAGTQLPGPSPPFLPAHMGSGSQPPRPSSSLSFEIHPFNLLKIKYKPKSTQFHGVNDPWGQCTLRKCSFLSLYNLLFILVTILQLSADQEKALLQQVMSLTPEHINQLPPDQRNQVLQLQQMLRQGLGSDDKAKWVNELISIEKPLIIGLQESKMDRMDENLIRCMWRSTAFGYSIVNAVGSSGGILTVWDNTWFFDTNNGGGWISCCSRVVERKTWASWVH